jgi:hypothetical protein
LVEPPSAGGTLAFVGGYLTVWTAFGIVAYALFELVRSLDVDALAWSRDGPYAAAAVIAIAAVYQLTALKDVCLAKCRSPLAFVVGSWGDGWVGALRMGIEHGAWCVGCCWALMATLFALGLMSIVWMAVIAALIGLERLLPWERIANLGIALLLVALALCVALAPERVPGLTRPGTSTMPSMKDSGTRSTEAPGGPRWVIELRGRGRVLERRLVTALAAQLELEWSVLDAQQLRDDLPTGPVVARDDAGHGLLTGQWLADADIDLAPHSKPAPTGHVVHLDRDMAHAQ